MQVLSLRQRPNWPLHFSNLPLNNRTTGASILMLAVKRLALICFVVTLALAGAAVAAAPPDGTLTVKNGIGPVVIMGKGAIIGHIDTGFVQTKAPDPTDGTGPTTNGPAAPRSINENTTRSPRPD